MILVLKLIFTKFEITHEMYHAEECFKIGKENYLLGSIGNGGSPADDLLRTYQREKYVFDKLMQTPNKWTNTEISYSKNYIETILNKCKKANIKIN